ncbi:MAG: lipocalin family protein [Bacteroidales bacterium]|nr:lipocalin family protein [Bacteroidales bacterium]
MKKSTLSIIVVAAVCMLAFSSCTKEEKASIQTAFSSCTKEKTMTEMLQIKKGWTLSTATSSPAYNLNGGGQIGNLFDGYVFDCEKDDIITFKEDGFEYMNPGDDVCDNQAADESSIGSYSLNEDAMTMDMQIPFFYDAAVESVKVVELTEDVLKVNYTFTEVEETTKAPGTYTFTLTYVPAK